MPSGPTGSASAQGAAQTAPEADRRGSTCSGRRGDTLYTTDLARCVGRRRCRSRQDVALASQARPRMAATKGAGAVRPDASASGMSDRPFAKTRGSRASDRQPRDRRRSCSRCTPRGLADVAASRTAESHRSAARERHRSLVAVRRVPGRLQLRPSIPREERRLHQEHQDGAAHQLLQHMPVRSHNRWVPVLELRIPRLLELVAAIPVEVAGICVRNGEEPRRDNEEVRGCGTHAPPDPAQSRGNQRRPPLRAESQDPDHVAAGLLRFRLSGHCEVEANVEDERLLATSCSARAFHPPSLKIFVAVPTTVPAKCSTVRHPACGELRQHVAAR